MSVFPEGLEPVADMAPAAWVRDSLSEWPPRPFEVRDLVPPVFEAYARILHRPARSRDGGEPTGTWFERASQFALTLSADTRWDAIAAKEPQEERWHVSEGGLSRAEVMELSTFLATHTHDPGACWFALWSGFGIYDPASYGYLRAYTMLRQRASYWATEARRWISSRRVRSYLRRTPTFPLLGRSRSYYLFEGAVGDAQRFHFEGPEWFQSPTLWWPDDRTWFVHTEIDDTSTYLGGSHELVGTLVGEQVLESFEVGAGDRAIL